MVGDLNSVVGVGDSLSTESAAVWGDPVNVWDVVAADFVLFSSSGSGAAAAAVCLPDSESSRLLESIASRAVVVPVFATSLQFVAVWLWRDKTDVPVLVVSSAISNPG